jgi:hypothetical protein
MKCDHNEPDVDNTSWKSTVDLNTNNFIEIELLKPNKVKIVQNNSNIYDNRFIK